jgi:hypothetical protein
LPPIGHPSLAGFDLLFRLPKTPHAGSGKEIQLKLSFQEADRQNVMKTNDDIARFL